MGKALLVIVLGSGLILTTQLYNASQQERETNEDQADYQEEVVAREIAQSAFNVGMGVVRAHGEKLQQGVVELNGTDNAGRSGTHTTGRFAGGAYDVRAELTSGHSVKVVATGRFGDAEYEMHDEYRVPVLIARHDGLIDVSFLESMAGYCSAVFYQAYTLDMEEGDVPEPIMIFAPDNRDRTSARPSQSIYVEAGTQMNFFIGVDENCDLQLASDTPECDVRKFARDFEFAATKFDHIHYALDVKAGSLDQAQESEWGLTEQHPTDRQRWRISWEDIHNTGWNDATSDDPAASLQALKRLGYDLLGWPTADSNGYRLLKDYGDRPDFSDQVIEVEVVRASHPSFFGKMTSARAKQANCGETIDDPVADPPVDLAAYPEADRDSILADIADILAEDGVMDAPDPDADDAEEQLAEYACECTSNGTNGKRPLLHRPPGNESNEQLLCLPQPARANAHLKNHNDIELSCQVRQNIQNVNRGRSGR